MSDSLERLRQYGGLSAERVTELNDLSKQLDAKYFLLQDEDQRNPNSHAEALLLFSQARAVGALAFAGAGKQLEAVYEASAAIDDSGQVFDAAFRAMSLP